ncbi:hypothetical protein [Halovenus halobia]|uniref:hypothetical protein n=1 Tax=Halovenus halobia TaxID=3396622 RepID=UPI003F57CD8F
MAVDAAGDSLAELAHQRGRLQIEANLSVTVEGRVFAVDGRGDRVVVQAPSVAACLVVLQQGSGFVAELANFLDAAGVTLEVRTGDAVLAVVGAEANAGRLTAALVSEAVEVRAGGVLAGLLRLR